MKVPQEASMSVPHSSTEWPRVGGIYRHRLLDGLSTQVISFDDGRFSHKYIHASGNEGCMGVACSGEIFRNHFRPEDQSPIPALVAALKAIYQDAIDRSTEVPSAIVDQVVAALALAGESSGEESDNADQR